MDHSESKWKVIAVVSPPNDVVLESLIQSFGIPVRLFHEAIGSVFGLSIGPLAEVKIAVPEEYAEQAEQLLQAESEKSDL
jgi:altronate dehydratase